MRTRPITELLDASRLQGLTTTPGGRIVASVSRLNAKGTGYRTELVELSAVESGGRRSSGHREERSGDGMVTLTRGSSSVGSVALAGDGTTLFTAKRIGEDGEESEDAQLWALPPRGESRELASRPGGFGSLHRGDGVLLAELAVHSQARTEAEHAKLTAERSDSGVTAALYGTFPTRYWDHDLGPSRSVLAIADLPADLFRAEASVDPAAEASAEGAATEEETASAGEATAADSRAGAEADSSAEVEGEGEGEKKPRKNVLHFRHLAMPPGRLIDWVADRAGTTVLVTLQDHRDVDLQLTHLYLLDTTGASEPRLLHEGTTDLTRSPEAISPDGRRALISREQHWTASASLSMTAEVLDLETVEFTPLWPELDQWISPEWLDDSTVVAASDDQGRGSLWIGGLEDAAPRRLAGGPDQELSFSGVAVAGGKVVAAATGVAVAPHPVLVDPISGDVLLLDNPADALEAPGSLTEVRATGEDGTEVRAWLRLPEGEGPHPLVVFAHGGPWGSWNAWTYRWNPNPFVASGYAVLMPDPAISTGYGQSMIDRGQHELGGAPFTDIMALVDATIARKDVDADRTAFSGGSYGGYMANWVAGHTGDRFRCVVTHASLWDTSTMGHTTDNSGWEASMREQNAQFNPKDSVTEIQVPVLVIHGDKDYRVPIAQGQALWYDLLTFSGTPRDAEGRTRHRYLYFPDEGHWIQGRGNAEVWYRTFLAFLDEHVLGETTEVPATLG